MDSAAERTDAYDAIKYDGLAMTFVKVTPGTYNPATGSVTNTTTSYPTYGIITEYKNFEIDGTLIKRGDKRVILAITSGMPEPNENDSLTINSATWAIKHVSAVMPSGTSIIYAIQVRK
jgi:hypothetical protein